MERRCVVYIGRVQGVGFRALTRAIVADFAISGWVRNESDGSVRLEVQGSAGELDACCNAIDQQLGRFIVSTRTHSLVVLEGEQGFRIVR